MDQQIQIEAVAVTYFPHNYWSSLNIFYLVVYLRPYFLIPHAACRPYCFCVWCLERYAEYMKLQRYLFMTKQVVYFTGDIYWTREVHCWWNVVSAFHLGAWWRWPSRSVATQCVNVLSFWESTTTFWEHCSVWGYFHDDRYVQVTPQEVWMLESYQNQDTVKIVLLSDIWIQQFWQFFLDLLQQAQGDLLHCRFGCSISKGSSISSKSISAAIIDQGKMLCEVSTFDAHFQYIVLLVWTTIYI